MTQIYALTLSEVEKLSDNVLCRFPKRRARAEKRKDRGGRLRCLGAGALLSFALPIDEEQLTVNVYGKPFAPQAEKSFNLSHSGDFVVLAVSDGIVGVDIQRIDFPRIRVAKRCFTEDEINWSKQDDTRFFTVWTMKESVAKAVGQGMRLPFGSFSVLPLLDGQSITVEALTLFGQTLCLPEYALSVCSTEPLLQKIEPVFVAAEEIEKAIL